MRKLLCWSFGHYEIRIPHIRKIFRHFYWFTIIPCLARRMGYNRISMSFSTNGELLIKDHIPMIKILKLYDAITFLGFDLTWGLIFTIQYIYLTSFSNDSNDVIMHYHFFI